MSPSWAGLIDRVVFSLLTATEGLQARETHSLLVVTSRWSRQLTRSQVTLSPMTSPDSLEALAWLIRSLPDQFFVPPLTDNIHGNAQRLGC